MSTNKYLFLLMSFLFSSALHAGPVHEAAAGGHLEHLRQWVEWGFDDGNEDQLDLVDDQGMTPIMHAAYHGINTTFDYLLDEGASINQIDTHGRSLVDLIRVANNESMREKVAKLVRENANSACIQIPTIFLAASLGDAQSVEKALGTIDLSLKGQIIHGDFKDKGKVSFLHRALQGGGTDMMKLLKKLQCGPNWLHDNEATVNSGEMRTLLRFAIYDSTGYMLKEILGKAKKEIQQQLLTEMGTELAYLAHIAHNAKGFRWLIIDEKVVVDFKLFEDWAGERVIHDVIARTQDLPLLEALVENHGLDPRPQLKELYLKIPLLKGMYAYLSKFDEDGQVASEVVVDLVNAATEDSRLYHLFKQNADAYFALLDDRAISRICKQAINRFDINTLTKLCAHDSAKEVIAQWRDDADESSLLHYLARRMHINDEEVVQIYQMLAETSLDVDAVDNTGKTAAEMLNDATRKMLGLPALAASEADSESSAVSTLPGDAADGETPDEDAVPETEVTSSGAQSRDLPGATPDDHGASPGRKPLGTGAESLPSQGMSSMQKGAAVVAILAAAKVGHSYYKKQQDDKKKRRKKKLAAAVAA